MNLSRVELPNLSHVPSQVEEAIAYIGSLPLAVKDTFPTTGLRRSYGSRAFADHVTGHDAVHLARLRAAGAIISGRSNAAGFAYGTQTADPLFGTSRDPYDLSWTVSALSGAAAPAVRRRGRRR